MLDGEDRGSPLEYFDASTNPAELPPSYNEAVSSESEGNIQHEVTPDDTINSLAIRYGASADAIRTANGLHGRNLQERKTVIIPASGVTRAAPQRSTVEQFMAVTGCTNRDEARSYLARCEGDANEAIRLYSEEISVENELLRVNAARVDADRQSVASGAGLLRGGKDKSKKKFLGIF